MAPRAKLHTDLEVYCSAFALAGHIFELSRHFPKEERYSLTDQIRRSSRSVCSNIAEAWRKRRYRAAFISKLSDSEAEAAETQCWLEFALSCGYIGQADMEGLTQSYDVVLSGIVGMIHHADSWILPRSNSAS